MYTKININEEGPIIPKITLKIFKAPFQKVLLVHIYKRKNGSKKPVCTSFGLVSHTQPYIPVNIENHTTTSSQYDYKLALITGFEIGTFLKTNKWNFTYRCGTIDQYKFIPPN